MPPISTQIPSQEPVLSAPFQNPVPPSVPVNLPQTESSAKNIIILILLLTVVAGTVFGLWKYQQAKNLAQLNTIKASIAEAETSTTTETLPVGSFESPVISSSTESLGVESGSTQVVQRPAVVFSSDTSSVPYGGSTVLRWTTTNPIDTCYLLNETTGTTFGLTKERSKNTGSITTSQTYKLYCEGPGGKSVTKSVVVTVALPAKVSCSSFDCLISAAKTCKPAVATHSISEEVAFGVKVTNTANTKYEVSPSSNSNDCTLAVSLVSFYASLSDTTRQQLLEQGETEDGILSYLKDLNDKNRLLVTGEKTSCSGSALSVSNYLTDIKNNTLPSAKYEMTQSATTATFTSSLGTTLTCRYPNSGATN